MFGNAKVPQGWASPKRETMMKFQLTIMMSLFVTFVAATDIETISMTCQLTIYESGTENVYRPPGLLSSLCCFKWENVKVKPEWVPSGTEKPFKFIPSRSWKFDEMIIRDRVAMVRRGDDSHLSYYEFNS
jgi:hypothetical protein